MEALSPGRARRPERRCPRPRGMARSAAPASRLPGSSTPLTDILSLVASLPYTQLVADLGLSDGHRVMVDAVPPGARCSTSDAPAATWRSCSPRPAARWSASSRTRRRRLPLAHTAKSVTVGDFEVWKCARRCRALSMPRSSAMSSNTCAIRLGARGDSGAAESRVASRRLDPQHRPLERTRATAARSLSLRRERAVRRDAPSFLHARIGARASRAGRLRRGARAVHARRAPAPPHPRRDGRRAAQTRAVRTAVRPDTRPRSP